MAAIDDALGESSVAYGPHQLNAYWREIGAVGDTVWNQADSISNLTAQSDGDIMISHSLDDGLPSPVTMSTGSDASGILTAGLLGKEGLVVATTGLRTYDGAGGSWDSVATTKSLTIPIPPAVVSGDFLVACVVINDSTATLVQTLTDPKDQWTFHGVIADSPYAMYVFSKRRWNSNNPLVTLESDKNVNFVSLTNAYWGRSPNGGVIDYRVTDVQLKAESVSGTAHSISATLKGRGYIATFSGAVNTNTLSVTAPQVLQGVQASNGISAISGYTGLLDAGVYTVATASSVATAVMVMAAVSVEPYERPRMNVQQYFSPFNKDSPIYGYTRDTATLTADVRVLTSTGAVDTRVFTGQMQGIELSGGEATLAGVSKTRIRMNRSVTLPFVGRNREGLTVDWLASWLMSRGSQFVGPAVNRYTRYWAPLHGSVHAHWDNQGVDASYNFGLEYKPPGPPGGPVGMRNALSVDGPFLTGVFAKQTAVGTSGLVLAPGAGIRNNSLTEFPHITEQGGPYMMDLMSKNNSKGRLCFWIRGDPATSAPSYLDAGNDYLFYAYVNYANAVGYRLGWVRLGIDSATRTPFIQMGNDNVGYTTVTFASSGVLPTDGNWYFYGFWFDFAAGSARVRGTAESSSTAWASGGKNDTTLWAQTDDESYRNAYTLSPVFNSHLPLSELMYDAGTPYSAGIWDDQLTTVAPGKSVTMRPTRQVMAGLAVPSAVNVWETLSQLAQATLSQYRVNEADNIEFLPLTYFGEAAQLVSSSVQDTTKNASELDITMDPSKVRNGVTVQFKDTRLDTRIQIVTQYLTALEIPRGTSTFVFPLDTPVVEIHGAPKGGVGTAFDIINLTSSQITTPSLPKTSHFVTINSAIDGSGSVLAALQVKATIVQYDAGSITIKFVNSSPTTAYLANNGDQVPFLQVLGYGVRQTDGYTTVSDTNSIMIRGERSIETELDWIQDRTTASDIAAQMLSLVARPRPELRLTVAGDPRRKPGQLITVLDSYQTSVAGSWRILDLNHKAKGPSYTQDLHVVRVLPAAVWDGLDGWDEGSWS